MTHTQAWNMYSIASTCETLCGRSLSVSKTLFLNYGFSMSGHCFVGRHSFIGRDLILVIETTLYLEGHKKGQPRVANKCMALFWRDLLFCLAIFNTARTSTNAIVNDGIPQLWVEGLAFQSVSHWQIFAAFQPWFSRPSSLLEVFWLLSEPPLGIEWDRGPFLAGLLLA